MNDLLNWRRRMLSIICVLLTVLMLDSGVVFAQNGWPREDAPPQNVPQSPAQDQAPLLSPAQLDTLVAPVALYPDALLSQVLVASTYPQEIADAAQWLQQNQILQGQQLVDAAQQQNWDPSIQALVVFPDVLVRLSSDIQWTTDLGNAFLAQQADVMNAVQRLRAQAMASGRLRSNAQETVTTQYQDGQNFVEIAPLNPEVVYVPEYNPEYIWGPPALGYYPPLYYPEYTVGFAFGPGIYIGSFFGGLGWGGWGWTPNWFGCSIYTNAFLFNHYGFHNFYGGYHHFGDRDWDRAFRGGVWAHNPVHRMGVPYSSSAVANRFHGTFAGRGVASPNGRFGRPTNPGANFVGRGNTVNPAPVNPGARAGWSHFGGSSRTVNPSPGFNSSPHGQGFAGDAYRATPSFRASVPSTPANRTAPSYGGNVYRPAPSYRGSVPNTPAYRTTPSYGGNVYRPAPSYRGSVPNTPAYRTAPSYGGNTYRPAPSYRGSVPNTPPAYRTMPSYGGNANRPAPSFSAPVRNVPTYHATPSFGGNAYRSAPSTGGGWGGVRSAPSVHSSPSFSGNSSHSSGGGFRSSSGGRGSFHGGGGSPHSSGGHGDRRR
jgi:uncharacterized membrane protein YgcG